MKYLDSLIVLAWVGLFAAGIMLGPANPAAAPPPAVNTAGINNVRDFGAAGDGAADDTAAIFRAIDALPAGGGIVYFPPGCYRFTNLDPRNKTLTLQGAGWSGTGGGPPGDKSWSDPKQFGGTRLLCAARSGAAFTAPLNYMLACSIRDLSIVGTNAPAVIGMDLRYNCHLRNVQVANFATGVLARTLSSCRFEQLNLRSCGVGFDGQTLTNCQFDRLEVDYCNSYCLKLTHSIGNVFIAPAFQGNFCPLQVQLAGDGAAGGGSRLNSFINLWSEAGASAAGRNSGRCIDVGSNCDLNRFDGLVLASGALDQIHVAGANNRFGPFVIVPAGPKLAIDASATGTVVVGEIPVDGKAVRQ